MDQLRFGNCSVELPYLVVTLFEYYMAVTTDVTGFMKKTLVVIKIVIITTGSNTFFSMWLNSFLSI